MAALQQLVDFILKVDDSYDPTSITTVTIAIQSLDELFVDQNCKLFAQNIDGLMNICATLVSQKNNAELMEMAQLYGFLSDVVQKYPKALKIKKQRITRLYKIAFDILAQVSSETTNEWLNPPNGFNPDNNPDNEESASKLTMSSVDSISEAVEFNDALLHIQPLFLQYMNKAQDWRYPYAALMITSQIAVENASSQNLGLIVQWALKATEHNHPKIRYAALHLIGQFSDDLNPQFQEMYYQSFVAVCNRLLQDSVPRVVAHTFSCATNFFENCKQVWKIQNLLGQFLSPIIHYIKTGNTWLKQTAISILSSFGLTENAYGPNLPNIFEIAFQIINTFAGQEDFKQVINQTVEMLSILIVSQKRSAVEPFFNLFITTLFANRVNISKDYFLQCWQRLCIEYTDFTDINAVFQFLLEACQQMEDNYGDDDRASGLRALAATFDSFKEKTTSFTEKTLEYAKKLFEDNQLGIKLREEAALLMSTVISGTKPSQPAGIAVWRSQAETIYNYICSKIQQIFDDFFDSSQLPFLFEALKSIIIALGSTLNGSELIALAEKQITLAESIYHAFKVVMIMKETNLDHEDDDLNSNQSQYVLAKQNQQFLEEAIDVIPDIMEELVKISSEPTTKMKIVGMIHGQIEKSIQKNNFMSLYCLNLSVTILQNLSYIEISQIWSKLIEIYVHFSQHPNARIRNGGIYGLNLIFSKTPKGILGKEEISKMLHYLSSSFTLPFQENSDKFYHKHCKDNVISALGSLLKNYASDFPDILTPEVFGYWLSSLPLNTDKTEGNNQQQFLMELLANNPSIIIKQVNDLKTVCQIYAKFIMRRRDKQYKEIVQKTKNSLMMMKDWSLFQGAADYLWNSLCNAHRNALTQLMNS